MGWRLGQKVGQRVLCFDSKENFVQTLVMKFLLDF